MRFRESLDYRQGLPYFKCHRRFAYNHLYEHFVLGSGLHPLTREHKSIEPKQWTLDVHCRSGRQIGWLHRPPEAFPFKKISPRFHVRLRKKQFKYQV